MTSDNAFLPIHRSPSLYEIVHPVVGQFVGQDRAGQGPVKVPGIRNTLDHSRSLVQPGGLKRRWHFIFTTPSGAQHGVTGSPPTEYRPLWLDKHFSGP